MALRAHIVLPEELVREVDQIAGPRKRSRFVESAVREKLEREALSAALRDTAGVVDLADYPQWSASAGISAWVRESRREDESSVGRKHGKRRA